MLTCTLRSRIVTCNVVENELWRVAIGRVKGKSLKVSNRKELNIAHVTMRCLCAVLHSPCSLHSDHAVSGSDPLRMIVGLKGFLPQRPAIYIYAFVSLVDTPRHGMVPLVASAPVSGTPLL